MTLEWIRVSGSYFCTEAGAAWTPIGQNDSISWPDLNGLFRSKDKASTIQYFSTLQNSGVTCMRMMMEYCHTNHYYLEKPEGVYQKNMVSFWDDLFSLCEEYSIRLLLTPYDTFWMWRRWQYHPYNKINGGTCGKRSEWLQCGQNMQRIKARFEFFIRRWGGSGALFGWDLWNEIHPRYSNNQMHSLNKYVDDISHFIRSLEISLYGKAHLQTVSAYGHELIGTEPLTSLLFRHPTLDFASTHIYEKGTIDSPKDTFAPAVAAGRLIRQALHEISDDRPFLDTEHGPIYTFSRRKITLDAAFDDAYFKHIQWVHLASGAAGGGMRWPYRNPHSLTPGMRKHQKLFSEFLRFIDWNNFKRINLSHEIITDLEEVTVFGCGSRDQIILWLLRKPKPGRRKISSPDHLPVKAGISVPVLEAGVYLITAYDTDNGNLKQWNHVESGKRVLAIEEFRSDLALAITRQQ